MRQPTNTVYFFGDFRLDPSERLLLRNGEPLPLTPKVLDALVLLVENAGHLVEKDAFMKRLWPETFVGDDTLAQNISLLRKALADGKGGPEWVATVPRRGYRFSGAVQRVTGQNLTSNPEEGGYEGKTGGVPSGSSGALHGLVIESPEPTGEGKTKAETTQNVQHKSKPDRSLLARLRLVAAAIIIGTFTGLLTYAFLIPPTAPRVVATTQITHSGRVDPWGRMISDGSRIYFLEREGDHWNLAQTSLAGGETQIIPVPFRNTVLLDLSPNHSEFLAASFAQRETEMPLWTWPVQGGAPTRLGDLTAYWAAWHPNGRQIVYAKNDGVYLADRDGSHARMFTPTNGHSWGFAWSPDGKTLRFSGFPSASHGSSIGEIRTDGTNLHQFLPRRGNPWLECCSSWSQDGHYSYFGSGDSEAGDIWGFHERSSFVGKRRSGPFRLTTGPNHYGLPIVVGADGSKLYAFGGELKIDLVNYDAKSRQFTPLLAGTRATSVKYSRDGQSVAYSTLDGILWRMKLDGTARSPLTAPPIRATDLAWSPDAKRIAFVSHPPGCENKLYLGSVEGGTPRELFPSDCEQLDPAWSPDGKLLGFARAEKLPSGEYARSTIELLDLSTNQSSTLAGSQGMRAPSWSPDGRFIAAITEDYHKLMLFDGHSGKWIELSEGTSLTSSLGWSRDGAFLYFQDLLAPNEAVNRIRIRDRKREEVANFENFIRSGVPRCAFIDLAPDGSLIVSLLRNHADIYALDLSGF